jgi:hypothetical protein
VPRTVEMSGHGSRLASLASTLHFVTKRLGWPYALLWLCTSLLRRLSVHIFVVTTHPIDDNPRHTGVSTAGVEARLLTCDEVMHYFDSDEAYCYSRAFAAEALSRGDRCVGLLRYGSLLWYCWYARGAAPVFDDVEAVADWPFLYGYNVYTDKAHRGCGLHEVGVNASERIFAREGYRAFTAYMEADNLPPLVAARKMGEEFVGFVVLHGTLGPMPWFATSGCRKAGFRLRRGSEMAPATQSAVPSTSPRVI